MIARRNAHILIHPVSDILYWKYKTITQLHKYLNFMEEPFTSVMNEKGIISYWIDWNFKTLAKVLITVCSLSIHDVLYPHLYIEEDYVDVKKASQTKYTAHHVEQHWFLFIHGTSKDLMKYSINLARKHKKSEDG